MLPESWVVKIFTTFEGRYGTLFKDRWKGCDLGNVKQTWREELAGFADQPERIGHALKSLADEKFPPTLPEFIAACRRAPAKEIPALPYKPTVEDEAKAKASIAAAAKALKPKFHDGIDRHWATHPRSEMQLRFIFQAAGNDSRFLPCIAEMVADGICTEDGPLLKMYRNGAWVKA
jgi:hypothetical protein